MFIFRAYSGIVESDSSYNTGYERSIYAELGEDAVTIAMVSTMEVWHDIIDRSRSFLVVDARQRDTYERGHIPGAVRVGWEEWCGRASPDAGTLLSQEGYWGELAEWPADLLGRRLSAAGISHDRPIVVYADGPRARGREGRVAWTLLYFGARTVLLLDGGWDGWMALGGPIEVGSVTPEPGRFPVEFQEDRRARLDELKALTYAGQLPQFVDARSRPEFDGYLHDYLPRRGRLPGAALVPFEDLFDASGEYITAHRYRDIVPVALREARRLVTYCEVGVRASLLALLHEIHLGEVAAVFDGSLMQWGLDPGLPVYSEAP